LSHELTMTGAPIVLVSAIPVLRSLGYEVVVLGPSDEGSLPLFLEAGAAVVTRRDCVTSSTLWELASSADFVLANTVVEAPAVRTLNGGFVPVLWWLHDAFAGYPFITHKIPKELADNVHIAAVGSHATAAIHSVRPKFKVEQLIYGLPDYARESFPRYDLSYAGGRPLFVTVGSMEMRKGQDIYCEAIRLLPPEVREKASFLFVGKASDRDVSAHVHALTEQFPHNVFYRKRLERPEIKSLMEQCTCIVCASRDDPMPTFVTEGLIFGKPSIVSEHTGTAGLITEGVDGFVYRNDDPVQLSKVLAHAIEHPDQLAAMKADCRKLYERYYTNEAYVSTLVRLIRELTESR
ncbi:MAG: glycosyltransferase, partial [Faecalibacterium sp.]|nr:glycosyltransferase [Faecalibacterium sp.]